LLSPSNGRGVGRNRKERVKADANTNVSLTLNAPFGKKGKGPSSRTPSKENLGTPERAGEGGLIRELTP